MRKLSEIVVVKKGIKTVAKVIVAIYIAGMVISDNAITALASEVLTLNPNPGDVINFTDALASNDITQKIEVNRLKVTFHHWSLMVLPEFM